MPSFSDTAVIAILALLLFGPKKLPELARQLGKLMAEFRRASNEFRMQMEDELRVAEQADRQKEIAAMTAAAPVAPLLLQDESIVVDHPHMPPPDNSISIAAPDSDSEKPDRHTGALPIAVSGELSMMPPATGLPLARTRPEAETVSALGPMLNAIPQVDPSSVDYSAHEAPVHG